MITDTIMLYDSNWYVPRSYANIQLTINVGIRKPFASHGPCTSYRADKVGVCVPVHHRRECRGADVGAGSAEAEAGPACYLAGANTASERWIFYSLKR